MFSLMQDNYSDELSNICHFMELVRTFYHDFDTN